MPRISQKTKLLELLTGNILSDILYLHILNDCNCFMFTSDKSYPLTFSREKRQLWILAIKQNFELKIQTVVFVWNSWLTADQYSTIQQFNSLGNTQTISVYLNIIYTFLKFIAGWKDHYDEDETGWSLWLQLCEVVWECWQFIVVSFRGLGCYISDGDYIQIFLNVVVPKVPLCTGDGSDDLQLSSLHMSVLCSPD